MQQNVQLFYLYNRNVLCSQPLALAQKCVADAGDLLGIQGIALGHDGHIGLAALQIHNAVGKALRLDERFQLGFKRDIADAVTQLGRQLLLLLTGQFGVLQGLFQGVQRSSRALLRVKRADSKNSVPESLFTLTSWASP